MNAEPKRGKWETFSRKVKLGSPKKGRALRCEFGELLGEVGNRGVTLIYRNFSLSFLHI